MTLFYNYNNFFSKNKLFTAKKHQLFAEVFSNPKKIKAADEYTLALSVLKTKRRQRHGLKHKVFDLLSIAVSHNVL